MRGICRVRAIVAGLAGLAGFLVLVAPAAPAAAQAAPGNVTGATIAKTAWWNQANNTDVTPLPGLTPPQPPAPPNVPTGSLPTSAVAGEPDKLTAIDIQPTASRGATVVSFILTLREKGDAPPGANVGHDVAGVAIVACPITDPFGWGEGENLSWTTKPPFDANLCSAPATRNADATWVFDLKPIGDQWLSATGTLEPGGIVIVEKVDAPGTFHVVFQKVDASGANAIAVDLQTTGGDSTENPSDGGSLGGSPSGSGTGFGSGSASGGGTTGGSFGGSPTAPGAPNATTAAAAPAESEPTEEAAAIEPAGDDGPLPILGNLPLATILLIPLALGIGWVMMLVLGPSAEAALAARSGGVSKALAVREAKGPGS